MLTTPGGPKMTTFWAIFGPPFWRVLNGFGPKSDCTRHPPDRVLAGPVKKWVQKWSKNGSKKGPKSAIFDHFLDHFWGHFWTPFLEVLNRSGKPPLP